MLNSLGNGLEISTSSTGIVANSTLPLSEISSAPEDTGCVVHIPARAGSTRVVNKNIREIQGLPLIAYTIALAIRLPGVDQVIVNTNSEEIASVAKEFGASVPFLRPNDISGSKASLADAEAFLLNELKECGVVPARIVTLLPTNPFRNLKRISDMIQDLIVFKRVASAHYVRVNWNDYLVKREWGMQFLSDSMKIKIPKGVYIKTNGIFFGRHLYLESKRTSLYHIIRDPVELVDLDTENDFKIANEIVKNKIFDFGFEL